MLLIGCFIGSSTLCQAMEREPSDTRKRALEPSDLVQEGETIKRMRLHNALREQIDHVVDLQTNYEQGNQVAFDLLPEAVLQLQDIDRSFQEMYSTSQADVQQEIQQLTTHIRSNPERGRKLIQALENDIKVLQEKSDQGDPGSLLRLSKARQFLQKILYAIKHSSKK